MNLGINSSMNNYNAINCKRNANPSFGMAVKVDGPATKVIKEQVLKMDAKKAEGFWEKFQALIDRQAENPVNIIVRKCKNRNALAAEVVDSQANNAVKNKSFSQGLFSKNGSLKFTKRAEAEANKLNEANVRIAELPKAAEKDFYAGGVMPETAKETVEVLESIH